MSLAKLISFCTRHGLTSEEVQALGDAGVAALGNLRPDIAVKWQQDIAQERPGNWPELSEPDAMDCFLGSLRMYAASHELTVAELQMIFEAGAGVAHNVCPDLRARLARNG